MDDQGILIGVDQDSGELKTIDHVVSGRACNCVCPGCGHELIAKKGQHNAHHFAHSALPPNIRACQETALHKAAKTLAASHIASMFLPARNIAITSTEKYISSSGYFCARHANVEEPARGAQRLCGRTEPLVPDISPYRPDAKLDTPEGPIYVEIHVTHPVPREKQQAMVRANIQAIEIDLSKVPRAGLTIEKLAALVSSEAPREWLSHGCDDLVGAAVKRLDADVREQEKARHATMLSQLRATACPGPINEINVELLYHSSSHQAIACRGVLPVDNYRKDRNYTLISLAGIHNTLIASIRDAATINRLFAWHQNSKKRPLTVLCIADTVTVYTSERSVLKHLVRQMHERSFKVSAPIHSVNVEGRPGEMTLSTPITQAFLANIPEQVLISNTVGHTAAKTLVKQRIFDVVIRSGGHRPQAYVCADIARQLNQTRQPGGIRETILFNIRQGQRFRVRFVPSIHETLKGDLYELLIVYRGELYLEAASLGRQRIYFNRADYWKKGGLLITPDPMHRGDFHLEASKTFTSLLTADSHG